MQTIKVVPSDFIPDFEAKGSKVVGEQVSDQPLALIKTGLSMTFVFSIQDAAEAVLARASINTSTRLITVIENPGEISISEIQHATQTVLGGALAILRRPES